MNVRWAVASFAKNIKLNPTFNSQKNYFPVVQNWFDQQGASSLIEKYNLRAYFNDLMAKSPEELAGESTKLCETRSRKFVENTFLEMSEVKNQIVLLEIGILHLHGVLKSKGNWCLNLSPDTLRIH